MVFIGGEVGQANELSLGVLHSYLETLADTGINEVKFQTKINTVYACAVAYFQMKDSHLDPACFHH